MTPTWTIHQGDVQDVAPTLAPASVDAVVTSPPYAMQRDPEYGGVPETDYPAWVLAWMDALRPALKERASVAIVIRPHVRGGILSDYVLQTRLLLRVHGWCELDEWIWTKSDAPPFAPNERPRRSWESILWFAPTPRPWCDPKANGRPSDQIGTPKSGLFSTNPRFTKKTHLGSYKPQKSGRSRGTDIAAFPVALNNKSGPLGAHPARYPSELAAWIIRYICPPAGVVLDPFSGSASTGVAALREERSYIGIERHADFVERSRKRLTAERQ